LYQFGVKAIGGGDPSYYQGWTIADEPITGSITKTLAYKNAFAISRWKIRSKRNKSYTHQQQILFSKRNMVCQNLKKLKNL
jgi:hypothetical protein